MIIFVHFLRFLAISLHIDLKIIDFLSFIAINIVSYNF